MQARAPWDVAFRCGNGALQSTPVSGAIHHWATGPRTRSLGLMAIALFSQARPSEPAMTYLAQMRGESPRIPFDLLWPDFPISKRGRLWGSGGLRFFG